MAILLPARLQVANKSMAFNYESTNSSAGASRPHKFSDCSQMWKNQH
jgi:hypothetical protein